MIELAEGGGGGGGGRWRTEKKPAFPPTTGQKMDLSGLALGAAYHIYAFNGYTSSESATVITIDSFSVPGILGPVPEARALDILAWPYGRGYFLNLRRVYLVRIHKRFRLSIQSLSSCNSEAISMLKITPPSFRIPSAA